MARLTPLAFAVSLGIAAIASAQDHDYSHIVKTCARGDAPGRGELEDARRAVSR